MLDYAAMSLAMVTAAESLKNCFGDYSDYKLTNKKSWFALVSWPGSSLVIIL
jgi:hypothetical protein